MIGFRITLNTYALFCYNIIIINKLQNNRSLKCLCLLNKSLKSHKSFQNSEAFKQILKKLNCSLFFSERCFLNIPLEVITLK